MNHESYPEGYIRSILEEVRSVALVGASSNPVRPSFFVLKYLLDKGYSAIPVNPGQAGKEILGRPVHASLKSIEEPIDMVDIFRGADAVPGIVQEALALEPRPKIIWMQLGIRHDEAAATAEAAGIKVVMNRCSKMEYGKLSGEWGWVGGYSGALSSRRQRLHESGRMQSLGLARPKP